jgi:hypothetical protein
MSELLDSPSLRCLNPQIKIEQYILLSTASRQAISRSLLLFDCTFVFVVFSYSYISIGIVGRLHYYYGTENTNQPSNWLLKSLFIIFSIRIAGVVFFLWRYVYIHGDIPRSIFNSFIDRQLFSNR